MRKIPKMIIISAFLIALSYVISVGTYTLAEGFGENDMFGENAVIEIEPVKVPLAAPPSLVFIPMPVASGTLVKNNDRAEIDYSNTEDGYIMVRCLNDTEKKMRVIVKGPGGESYTYSLNSSGDYEVFPLSEGNGSYQAGVYENIKGTKYSAVISTTFQVALSDEFAPFLRPNQYVSYNSSSGAVRKAMEITGNSSGIVAKISSVYGYVTENITYDKELAQTVQSGYLSDVDEVLSKGKGICFDYAAVMTVMLRSLQIPTKLVIGYSGNNYHAWVNVYSSETGWIDNAIYFDGASWKLMDPTFTASKSTNSTTEASYTAKLIY